MPLHLWPATHIHTTPSMHRPLSQKVQVKPGLVVSDRYRVCKIIGSGSFGLFKSLLSNVFSQSFLQVKFTRDTTSSPVRKLQLKLKQPLLHSRS